jgi:hypothetical protein
MYLIQLLLPRYDKDKKPHPRKLFDEVSSLLVQSFGGVTLYQNAPADGLWDDGQEVSYDSIIIVEVMIAVPDKEWWKRYGQKLEHDFDQEKLIIRAIPFENFN